MLCDSAGCRGSGVKGDRGISQQAPFCSILHPFSGNLACTMVTGWDTNNPPSPLLPSMRAPAVFCTGKGDGATQLRPAAPAHSFPSLGQAPQAGREHTGTGKLLPGPSHGLRSPETAQGVRSNWMSLFAAGSTFSLGAGGVRGPIRTGQSMPGPRGFWLPAGCQRNVGLLGHQGRE